MKSGFGIEAILEPGLVIFDDFDYQTWRDTAAGQFGWRFRTGTGWPGVDARWSADNITFHADSADSTNRIMRFSSSTDGVPGETTRMCQASKQPPVCLHGTFASRVYFRNAAVSGPDTRSDMFTQTFYQIVCIEGNYADPGFPLNSYPCDRDPYSELDFEYMPHGGWGTNVYGMTNTSWQSGNPRSVEGVNEGDYSGWHVCWIVSTPDHVSYFIDDKELFTHTTHLAQTVMSMNYNQWFIQLSGTRGEVRTYQEDMDWVMYVNEQYLNLGEIEQVVEEFRRRGVSRIDSTLDEGLTAALPRTRPQWTTDHGIEVVRGPDGEICITGATGRLTGTRIYDLSGRRIRSVRPVLNGKPVSVEQVPPGVLIVVGASDASRMPVKMILPWVGGAR